MTGLTDAQLLGEYAERRTEAAFGEMVRRYTDFVYSAALRTVRDAQSAEDVTQGVFLALSQNARQLTIRTAVSGWLHRTTRNLAANAVRSEVRRRTREQEAVAMSEPLWTETDGGWETIAPEIDTALEELSEPDRDSLLLHYFHSQAGP